MGSDEEHSGTKGSGRAALSVSICDTAIVIPWAEAPSSHTNLKHGKRVPSKSGDGQKKHTSGFVE